VIASYGYDVLNRLSSISYNDGTPALSFTYGGAGAASFGAGRLIATTDGVGSQSYQYNNMGLVTQITRSMSGSSYVVRYSYNPAGQIATVTYPSGRVVNERYDSMGRLTQVGSGGNMVASVGSYNAAGQLLSVTYGNGMQGTFGFNQQGQIASIQYGSTAGSILNLGYNYGSNDNGRILGITDNVTPARSTAYSYDELNRIKIAQTVDLTSPNTWELKYSYDRYGNRLGQIPAAGTATMPVAQLLVDPNTNRIIASGITYDAAGNMTSDGLHAYAFDAENRIKTADGTANAYAYDWAGMRVKKNGALYIYSGPKVIAEYASGALPASPSVEYIYLKDQMTAKIAGGTTTYFYGDHLSPRNEANASGTVLRTSGHFPFGDMWYETGASDKWKFTTYERDAESGLDYAQARYDSPALGRFMSVDPAAASSTDPQTLNRYPYAGNDPINRTDPSGLYPQDQHEFITFLMASLAQQSGNFAWDPTQLALGARDADNFENAATGLLGLGSFLNLEKHFGINGPLDSDTYTEGIDYHQWEDKGNEGERPN
jgi:RHS repeat-associated protein